MQDHETKIFIAEHGEDKQQLGGKVKNQTVDSEGTEMEDNNKTPTREELPPSSALKVKMSMDGRGFRSRSSHPPADKVELARVASFCLLLEMRVSWKQKYSVSSIAGLGVSHSTQRLGASEWRLEGDSSIIFTGLSPLSTSHR